MVVGKLSSIFENNLKSVGGTWRSWGPLECEVEYWVKPLTSPSSTLFPPVQFPNPVSIQDVRRIS